ncbi:MAG: PQQ-binding-like beta-propeller repeat protein [Planctomyces sp.]|nr:PQQ-binding-like beta-propeller repeat protein [Planctomyces sp.]
MARNVQAEDYDDDPGNDDRDIERRQKENERARRQLERGPITRLFDTIAGGASRPGEQDVVRSPAVMVLFGSTIAVSLLAALFLFMYFSENESRSLKQCMTALETQKYSEAEKLFIKFLENYAKSKSGDTARLGLHRTRVEKNIMTATVDVVEGLKQLDEMVRIGKELSGFEEQRDNIRRYADRLTFAGARVAEISQKQEHLNVSIEAMAILKRFSPENQIPKDREEELIRRQRIAEAAILKRTVFEDAKKQIRGFLDAGNTTSAVTSRQDLIEQYEVFRDDKDIAALLQEILKRELELTVRSDIGVDAKTDDPRVPSNGLSLTLRTSATNDQVSQGQLVFSMGIDSCFAVDTVTGEPRWKRVIGSSPAFSPIQVNGSDPAVLVHDSNLNELVLLRQSDGKLLWRQAVGSRPSGEPLLFEQQLYVTTDAGELLQIAVANGRAIARIKFTQRVIGPPTLSRDAKSLLIPGDQMFVYSLSISPLACTTVSYINYRPGSVEAPMITAGEVFVLYDNDTPGACRVRVLQKDAATGQLSVRATESVDGQVRDPSLLWGGQLYVPSSPQRVTVFRITDDPDQAPLSKVGANQLEDGIQTRMFLLAGSGGQLWLSGRNLRKFDTQTNALMLNSAATAEGIHIQPIQDAGENVYITSREATLSSVYLTCADKDQMKGVWRTVLATNVVALGGSTNEGNVLAVGDFGKVYRASLSDIQKGGFLLESVSEFRLPDKLASPVDGLATLDNRLVAYCGAPEPALWTISPVGQLERRWNLPDAPQGKPVAIAAGIVMPLPGRLHLTATRDGNPAEDYRAAQAAGEQGGWKSLTALSDTMVLAVNSANELIRVEYRPSPRPQLAEVGISRIEHPIELPPAADAGLLYIATADGHLLALQATTLEILADVDLGAVPSASPRISGNRLFLEVGGTELRTFVIDNGLREAGRIRIDGRSLAGVPLRLPSDGFLAAFSDGTLLRINGDGVQEGDSTSIGQALRQGPVVIGGIPMLLAIDGSLHVIPAELLK